MRYLPLTPDDREAMLAAIGAKSIDDLFIDVPQAARREMERSQVLTLADGSIFTGRQALANGLVDALGGEAEIRAYLKSRDIDDTLEFVDWEPASESENLLLGASVASILRQLTGMPASLSDEIDRLSGGKLFLDGLVSVWQVGSQSERVE